MTRYIDSQAMIDRFGEREMIELTDRDRTDAIDAAVLDLAIRDAEALADSYLAGRYRLPLPAAAVETSGLPAAVADLARYNLYGAKAPEEVQDRRDRAAAWLRDLSTGKAALGIEDTSATPPGRVVVGTGNSAIDWSTH